MSARTTAGARVFKTAWFAKAARKAAISDLDLCDAVNRVMLGQADDLGGGVFKRRLIKNAYRSIILAKGGRWIFAYLFAKKDRANITAEELDAFRILARSYGGLTGQQLAQLRNDEELTEICHDSYTQVQERRI